jgi:hypothetical protein
MFHSGGNHFSNILSYKDNANILGGLGSIQRLIDFSRRGSHSPADTCEGESQHCIRMANYQDFHRFLSKQNQEGDEQTVDGNTFCKTYEDERPTEGFWLFSNSADRCRPSAAYRYTSAKRCQACRDACCQ